jgi:hypothetical protein
MPVAFMPRGSRTADTCPIDWVSTVRTDWPRSHGVAASMPSLVQERAKPSNPIGVVVFFGNEDPLNYWDGGGRAAGTSASVPVPEPSIEHLPRQVEDDPPPPPRVGVLTALGQGADWRSSASWTLASCWDASQGHPPGSKQMRRALVSCSLLLPACATIGYRLRGPLASDRPELRPPPITREGFYK